MSLTRVLPPVYRPLCFVYMLRTADTSAPTAYLLSYCVLRSGWSDTTIAHGRA